MYVSLSLYIYIYTIPVHIYIYIHTYRYLGSLPEPLPKPLGGKAAHDKSLLYYTILHYTILHYTRLDCSICSNYYIMLYLSIL